MRKQGTVVRWDPAKAFGFIRSEQTVADIFFHMRDFSGHQPPSEGLPVTFQEIHVGGKGPRALSVEPLRNELKAPFETPKAVVPPEAELLPRAAPARRSPSAREKRREELPLWIGLGLIVFWLLLWLVGIGLGRFPWVILTAVVLINLGTFYMYWRDKDAAVNETQRTPEDQLHALALLGGWPGAWFAQQILRHKTSKQPFRLYYWTTVAVNTIALLGWIAWPAIR
ncbi:cold shock and DUF1294 domain-containing protein [Hydrogenophaga sp.]|uniref:cold shock and DUF1294 domain-containing protein n=1 Tax=Hydrogenophaga sp. TaxID=1904254 RepID=UPI002FCC8BB8